MVDLARHGQQADHTLKVWTGPAGYPVAHTSPNFRRWPDALALAKQPFEKNAGKPNSRETASRICWIEIASSNAARTNQTGPSCDFFKN
jgi:hypothetical protein